MRMRLVRAPAPDSSETLRSGTSNSPAGLAVYRRGADTDLQALTVAAIQPVAPGAGLHVHGKQQVFAVPLEPGCRQAGSASQGQDQHTCDLQGNQGKQGRKIDA